MMAILAAVGGILLFLLKAILILLGVLVGLIVLFLIVPVSVDAVYEKQEYTVKVGLFGIPIQVYPVPGWLKRFLGEETEDEPEPPVTGTDAESQSASMQTAQQQQPPKPQEVQKQSQQQPSNEPLSQPTPKKEQPSEKAETPPKAETATKEAPAQKVEKKSASNIDIQKILSILETANGAIARLMKGIWISLWIRWPIQGQDAADTAVSFGKWNARVGGICALLSNLMQFRLRQLDLIPDFQGEYQKQERVRVKLTASLILLCIALLWALNQLKKKKIF